ncbi:MAG: hypothetical protein AMXMBFR47_05860 [Planctomycetota bacterium]
MFINRIREWETGAAAGEARRRIAEADDLDCDAIGLLIVEEALRRTVNDLRRFTETSVQGSLEELS